MKSTVSAQNSANGAMYPSFCVKPLRPDIQLLNKIFPQVRKVSSWNPHRCIQCLQDLVPSSRSYTYHYDVHLCGGFSTAKRAPASWSGLHGDIQFLQQDNSCCRGTRKPLPLRAYGNHLSAQLQLFAPGVLPPPAQRSTKKIAIFDICVPERHVEEQLPGKE